MTWGQKPSETQFLILKPGKQKLINVYKINIQQWTRIHYNQEQS